MPKIPDQGAAETLSAPQLGIQSERDRPFDFCPGRHWSPVVLSFPHAGLLWPSSLGPVPRVDFRRHADYAVERLIGEVAEFGIATLTARFSRLVVDLNRAPDDVSAEVVPDHPAPRPRSAPNALAQLAQAQSISLPHRGILWPESLGRVRLLKKLSYSRFCDRLARFYDPYHRALECLLQRRRQRFGYAILIDVHSMPSFVGPDIVVGTRDGRSCGPELLDRLRFFFPPATQGGEKKSVEGGASAWVCTYDHPYPGGHITASFGRPEQGIHALQLEFSRALYLDEHSFRLRLPPQRRFSGPERKGLGSSPILGNYDGGERSFGDPAKSPARIGTLASQAVRSRVHALLLELSDRFIPRENLEPPHRAE